MAPPSAWRAALLVLLLSGVARPASQPAWPISQVVVIMFENRSFDHMCGYLKQLNPDIDGLSGNESNPVKPADPTSPNVTVNPDAPYASPDGDHSVPGTFFEVFGNADQVIDPPPMNGFVAQQEKNEPGTGAQVLSCFNHSSVPIISTLAQEFAIFDRWYSSVPGPTFVNRLYSVSGTSDGSSDNSNRRIIDGYPQRPLFVNLEEAGISWEIFFEQISFALGFSQMRAPKMLRHFSLFEDFIAKAKNGTLPQFTYLEPRYYPMFDLPATDQHPAHLVNEGERVMKLVYETLRASPQWNSTLLIITYDEHGGFYDHVPTPIHGVPNPDGINATAPDPPFNFTRLGVRVPTVMVSPWINKGTVVHEASGPTPSSHFDHTSVPATMKKVFNLPAFLTKRDAWAGTFEDVVMQRSEPRTDCPMTLPEVPDLATEDLEAEQNAPLTDLQEELLDWAIALHAKGGSLHPLERAKIRTQLDAGLFVQQLTRCFVHAEPCPTLTFAPPSASA